MAWQIRDHGFEMTLSPEVPQIIERQLAPFDLLGAVKQLADRLGIEQFAIVGRAQELAQLRVVERQRSGPPPGGRQGAAIPYSLPRRSRNTSAV